MVKLSEVTDEHFEEVQQGPSDNDDDFEEYSDTDSEISAHAGHSHGHQQHHRSSSHGARGSKQQKQQPSRGRFASVADEDDEDSDSDDDDDELTIEESLYERFVALKDMIPIKQRTRIVNTVKGFWGLVSWGAKGAGNIGFVVSTGVLMLGVPYALAVAEEGQMLEMEREMKMQQQANELIQSTSSPGQQQQGGIRIQ